MTLESDVSPNQCFTKISMGISMSFHQFIWFGTYLIVSTYETLNHCYAFELSSELPIDEAHVVFNINDVSFSEPNLRLLVDDVGIMPDTTVDRPFDAHIFNPECCIYS